MGKLQQRRAKAISLRGASALGGAVVMAASVTQVASTLAAPDEVRQAKAGISTQNFSPTPLTGWVTCTTDPNGGDLVARRARIDWDPVPGATGYRVDLVNDTTGAVESRVVRAGTTRIPGVVAPRAFFQYARGLLIRVRTINEDAVSSGYTTSARKAQAKDQVSGRTECEGSSGLSVPNADWENQHEWDTGIIPFAMGLSPSFFGRIFDDDDPQVLLGELPEKDALTSLDEATVDVAQADEGHADVTAEAGEEASGETHSPNADETRRAPSTSLTTSATARTPVPPRSSTTSTPSSSATTKPSTRAKSTPTPTSPRAPSTSPLAITTTTQAPSTPVRLSGGREAEIADGTRLVVSVAGAPKCTVLVRKGSTLDVRDGVLEITDAVETRAVDPDSCVLTKM